MKKFLLNIVVAFITFSTFAQNGYLNITVNNFYGANLVGAKVVKTIKNGAADKFGLKANDIITAVNGEQVSSQNDIITILAKYKVNEQVDIVYVRDGKEATKKITLGVKPIAINYKLDKSTKPDGEHWSFTNEQIEIVLKDNKPTVYFIKDEKGIIETVNVNKTDNEFVKKYNIEDMLAAIEEIKERADNCNCNCPLKGYTYFKMPVEEKAVVKEETVAFNKFNISPNPTAGIFIMDFAANQKGTFNYTILDINGRIVSTENIANFDGYFTKQFNLEKEPKGMYIINVSVGDKRASKKIILQ